MSNEKNKLNKNKTKGTNRGKRKNHKRAIKVTSGNIVISAFILIFAITMTVNLRALAVDEEENNTGNTTTSSNATYVTDSDGVQVPVPEGYTASQVDGETTVSGGFVIYEGNIDWSAVLSDTEVTDWDAVISGSSSNNTNSNNTKASASASSANTTVAVATTSLEEENGISTASLEEEDEEEEEQSEEEETNSTSENTTNSNTSNTNTSVNETETESTEEEEEEDEDEEDEEEEDKDKEDEDEDKEEDEEDDDDKDKDNEEDDDDEDNGEDNESEETENNTTTSNSLTLTSTGTDGTGNEGISVASEEGGELTQEEINVLNLQTKVNQYVWVPVSEENLTRIYGTDSSGKMWGKLYSSWSTTSDRSYRNTYWSETSDGVFTISNLSSFLAGYREPDVTHYNTSYDIDSRLESYLDGSTEYELLSKELEQSFYDIMESIKKYGGFYIGRYETGGLSSTTSNTAVVQKMNTSISSATWYVMYEQCKSLGYENDAVETSMIWGCLWDETLQWLLESGATTSDGTTITSSLISSNSTTWGNYYNSTFTYYTTAGSWDTTATKATSSSTKIPAGSAEYTKVNNIYDMAGNVWDWTLEGNSTNYRVYRGGYYNNYGYSYPAGYRRSYYPAYSSSNYGCRAVLYIK